MAFGDTGVLDNANRSDENPINTNWSSPLFVGDGALKVVSNQITPHVAFGQSYWDTTFGPDCEAFVTWATANTGCEIYGRVADPNSSFDAYGIICFQSGTARLVRIDNESETQLGAGFSPTFSSGDKIGLEITGTTIGWYHDTGSGWGTAQGTRTDSTYSAAGHIGLIGQATGDVFDDWGGGTQAGDVIVTPTAVSAVALTVNPTVLPKNIELIATSTANTNNEASTTLAVPTGTQDGDVIVFCGSCDGTVGYNIPSGFSTDEDANTPGTHNNIMGHKVASSEPANYTISVGSGTERGWCAFLTYRNVDNTTPVNKSNSNTGGSNTTGVITSITPDNNDSCVVVFAGLESGNAGNPVVTSWPGSLVEQLDNDNGPPGTGNGSSAGAVAHEIQSGAGSAVSGNISLTGGNTNWGVMALVLNKAVDSVTVTPTAASAVAAKVDPTVVQGTITLTPNAASAVADKVDPNTVQASISITPTPGAVIARKVDPTVVLASIVLSPAAAAAVAASEGPVTVLGSMVVTPDPAAAVAAAIGPSVEQGSLIIVPTAASAVAGKVDPTVIRGSITINPVDVSAVAGRNGPQVVLGTLVFTPSPAEAVAAGVDPNVSAGALLVQPASASAIAAGADPTVLLGSIALAPQAASAVASAVDPAVIISGEGPAGEGDYVQAIIHPGSLMTR